MMKFVSFQPLLPISWLIILFCLMAIFVLMGVIMRRRGSILRVFALAALTLALVNPMTMEETREPVKSTVGIVIDRSQSQKFGMRGDDTNQAIAQLKTELAKYPQLEPRFIDAAAVDDDNDGTQTKLFAPLSKGISDIAPSRYAGTIMITDGQVHDIPNTLEGSDKAPLNALITGRPDEFDRELKFIEPPRFGLTNKSIKLQIMVEDKGVNTNAPKQANVTINVDGVASPILSVEVGKKTDIEVTLPHAGKNIIEASTPNLNGELTDVNNRTVAIIDAVRENLRVLLISGEPHNGERTWRDLLKSDASIDLVHFTILRLPETIDDTPTSQMSLIVFPTTELFVDKINDFDLVIFDRYQHYDVLPLIYYDYIAQYVQNGGALLMATGPEFAGPSSLAQTPLISVLPALPDGNMIEKPFRPSITKMGEHHPVTRGLNDNINGTNKDNKWGRWMRQITIKDSGKSTVLMNGADNKPLMLLDHVGKGRVGMLLSDEGWLWARGFEGGGPYAALYRRMAHWLMREPELEEEALTATGDNHHLTIMRQTMSDKVEPAIVTSPSGKKQTIKLKKQKEGIFSATIESDEIGLFRIINGDKSALAHVGPVNAEEFSELISTEKKLTPIAQQTGGNVIRLHKNSNDNVHVPAINFINASIMNKNGTENVINLKQANQTRLVNAFKIPIFSGILALIACIALFGSMWYREGR